MIVYLIHLVVENCSCFRRYCIVQINVLKIIIRQINLSEVESGQIIIVFLSKLIIFPLRNTVISAVVIIRGGRSREIIENRLNIRFGS